MSQGKPLEPPVVAAAEKALARQKFVTPQIKPAIDQVLADWSAPDAR